MPNIKLRTGTILALTLSLMAARAALGATITARVVGIQDGDTITVIAQGNVQYRIRLAGIDAPEHNQAFGSRSKESLSRLIFGKTVNLDCGKEECYGRLSARCCPPMARTHASTRRYTGG